MSVVSVVDVCAVEGVVELAVIEVAGVEVATEVVILVVAGVTALVGDVGVDVMVALGSEGIKVDTGVTSVVEVVAGCGVETEVGLGSPLVVVVKVLVVTGVEVVNVGELTVSVGVTEDVTGGVEVVPVVWDSVEVSLVPVVLQVDVISEGVPVVSPVCAVATVEELVSVVVAVVYVTLVVDASVDMVVVLCELVLVAVEVGLPV